MSLKIEKLIEDSKLEVLVKGKSGKEITVSDISRPGLQFAGYYEYFVSSRLQLMGMAEWSFLTTMDKELRRKRLDEYFSFGVPCLIISRDLIPHNEIVECAEKHGTWVLRSKRVTTRLTNKLANYLDRQLAQETVVHGVLIDVYGIGILITGESGVGKSETALELIKRGHRLISDDAVNIKNIDDELYGTSPYITHGMIEVRGMGIIDVPALYGLSSIAEEKKIELVIHMEHWGKDKNYDRLGTAGEKTDILNVHIRKLTLPIMPGRNLAVIIEAAAVNYRYKLVSKETPVEKIEKRINELNRSERQ